MLWIASDKQKSSEEENHFADRIVGKLSPGSLRIYCCLSIAKVCESLLIGNFFIDHICVSQTTPQSILCFPSPTDDSSRPSRSTQNANRYRPPHQEHGSVPETLHSRVHSPMLVSYRVGPLVRLGQEGSQIARVCEGRTRILEGETSVRKCLFCIHTRLNKL